MESVFVCRDNFEYTPNAGRRRHEKSNTIQGSLKNGAVFGVVGNYCRTAAAPLVKSDQQQNVAWRFLHDSSSEHEVCTSNRTIQNK